MLEALASILIAVTTADAAEWANLTGRFVYDGKAPAPRVLSSSKDAAFCGGMTDECLLVDEENRALANVVIWVRTNDIKVHPDYAKSANEETFIEIKRCRFDPHVVVCRTGQPLVLLNSDSTANNVKCELINNPQFNLEVAADSTEELKPLEFQEPSPVRVLSNSNSAMLCWIVVLSHPFVDISDRGGKFEIKNLPAGTELEFQVWHEKAGWVKKAIIGGNDAGWQLGRFKMTLKTGDNELGEIKLDPAQFKN